MPQVLLVDFAGDVHFGAMLQHKEHARPLGLAGVLPAMHGGSLHDNVASPQGFAFAGIQQQLDGTLDDDAVVDALGAVHQRGRAGGEVGHPCDGAEWIGEAQSASRDKIIVGLDINVLVKGDGKLGSGVDHVQTESIVQQPGPVARADRMNDRFASDLVVTGKIVGYAGKVRSDLAWIGRTRVGHDQKR